MPKVFRRISDAQQNDHLKPMPKPGAKEQTKANAMIVQTYIKR